MSQAACPRGESAGPSVPPALHPSSTASRGDSTDSVGHRPTDVPTLPSADDDKLQQCQLETERHHSTVSQTQLQKPEVNPGSGSLLGDFQSSDLADLEQCGHMHDSSLQHSHDRQMSGSPQSARSSQSDATHLDHPDNYQHEGEWQAAQQEPAAGMDSSEGHCQASSTGCQTSSGPQVVGDTKIQVQGTLSVHGNNTAGSGSPGLQHRGYVLLVSKWWGKQQLPVLSQKQSD